MQKIEIRFDGDRELTKSRLRNVTLEICEKVLDAGRETANLKRSNQRPVILCKVQDASRAWSKMQDCLENRGVIDDATVFVQQAEDEPLTQVYPIT